MKDMYGCGCPVYGYPGMGYNDGNNSGWIWAIIIVVFIIFFLFCGNNWNSGNNCNNRGC